TNGVPVSKLSKVLAVRIKGDKIKDSDATGRIVMAIEPGESLEQEDAFFDPNLNAYAKHKDEYRILIIDEEYLTK
ncbi:MAG: hypothetical protein KBS66_07855, partial [Eubacterium sp.]|nr:hypothetical protein [Candidatus Colimonas fimequi]